MPEIFHRRNSNVSIRQALSRTLLELLPVEIREDSLARWVMDFDDLRSRDRFERPFREDPDNYATWALALVVIGGLQRQIPFYFATLFQIGRQWKVSESALASIEGASSQENLGATARLNRQPVDRLRRKGSVGEMYERSEGDATEALRSILRSASKQHSDRLREARQWWTSWREEVGSIREQVDRLQEIGHRRPDLLWSEASQFLLKSYRPSPLRQTLEASGVRFAGEAAPTTAFSGSGSYLEVLTPLLFLGLSLGRLEGYKDFFFVWHNILHNLLDEVKYGEARRIGLQKLARKYSQGEDPFEPYLPLGKPATEVLRNLVIEHTLQGYQSSPWLERWRDCVRFNSSTALKIPLKDLKDRENLAAFARGADCAIKQSLDHELRPGETWDEFMQRLFETEWVLTTARQLVVNESNAKVWRFEAFAALVAAVVSALNDLGYRIDLPSEDRLQVLWERLHGKEPWSVCEW
jgi:hypothetical protein